MPTVATAGTPASRSRMASSAQRHSSTDMYTLTASIRPTSTLPGAPGVLPWAGKSGVEALEAVLDAQRTAEQLFLGRYSLLGPAARRTGGQGLVQFATQPEPLLSVAIKVRCCSFSFADSVCCCGDSRSYALGRSLEANGHANAPQRREYVVNCCWTML